MGLSLNPMSWTPSNLAESAVEFVTGSEAAGDVAGLLMANMTGDVAGVADQGMDLGENVVAGGKKLLEGFGNALKDAFQVFSNPGAVKQPDAAQAPTEGYKPGEATGPNDTGAIGNPPTGQTGETGKTDGASFADSLKGMSLEDKIFAILMKLQEKKEGELDTLVGGMGDKTADKLSQKDMVNLQRIQSDLSQLSTLTTNLMNTFKQMKDSVIQNIR